MNGTSAVVWIWIIAILLHKQAASLLPPSDKKCHYNRLDRGILKGICVDLDLREIPQNLKTNIELLDVHSNKIKKLNKSSFQNYGGIQYLILSDNKIQTVEPGTFSQLTSLEAIDISDNSLVTIPAEFFNLPSLRNLFVDSNDLSQLTETLAEIEKPIQAPLEHLNIASCGLTKLPDFGIMPYLLHLNASMNALHEISAQNFVSMCSIRSVDLKQTEMDPCACRSVVEYLEEERGLNVFDRIDCDIIDVEMCSDLPPINNTEFNDCKQLLQNKKTRNMWIYIAIGIGGSLLICLVILICCHRRNKAKRLRRIRNIKRQVAIENCNEELLKNTNSI